ncbi:multiprotein-bridging factor 1 family protein [Massilia sp.]|uniref:helix-turn-helix domain-containing protein n=1 Tax=Massilia sp. TaxID=1882437 RepID=UPI00391D7463
MHSLPPVTDPSFRQKLREAREARKLSQYALAKLAGVALVMPRRYEDAKDKYATLPNPATWAKLNAVLFPPDPQTATATSGQPPAPLSHGKADKHLALECASIEEIVGELKRRGAASVVINW